MEKQYWEKKWEQNEIGFNQKNPHGLLSRLIPPLQLLPGSKIFVPLCGKSIDMIWFLEQGYEVIGVELSQIACEDFFNEYHIKASISYQEDWIIYKNQERKITLFCGDFFRINKSFLQNIDLVYDRAALIALPQTLRLKYAQHMVNLIDLETKILLITIVYDESKMQGPPFSVDENEVQILYQSHFIIEQLYNAPILSIAPHLQAKGLIEANEQAYMLTYSIF